MKNFRLLATLVLVIVLCGIGYQLVIINKDRKYRIENSYTPESIIDDSRSLFSTDGSLVLPEQPTEVVAQPGDTALAAYRYSKLLQDKFPQLLTQEQHALLSDIATNTQHPNLVRLYAYAALKRSGADYDRQMASSLAVDSLASLPDTISEETVSSYMDIAEVALDIDSNVQLKPLEGYTATEPQERLAVAILVQTYLFANEAEVKVMFPEIRSKLEDWAFGQESMSLIDRYLLSSLAYINLNSLTSEQRQLLQDKDQSLARCEKAPSFIAVEVQGQQVCSLLLTEIYYQRGIGHG